MRILWILLIFGLLKIAKAQRICELQGTCHRCEQNRFSFYTCHSSEDCFPEEYCTPQRFCCPVSALPQQIVARNDPIPTASISKSDANAEKFKQKDSGPRCPDDSEWLRMCKVDSDCIFRDEICAEGKCCPSCKQRRTQVLAEIPHSMEETDGLWIPTSFIIPQCELDDWRFYKPMQCRRGTADCFCVTRYGRRLTEQINLRDLNLNCTAMRDTDPKNQHHHHPQIGFALPDLKNLTAPLAKIIAPIFASQESEILSTRKSSNKSKKIHQQRHLESVDGILEIGSSRNAGNNIKQQNDEEEQNNPSYTQRDAIERCTDPLREFKICGSTCPISCATRNSPKCPPEKCQAGCFCRLPYVILDSAKPFSSKCVLPAECPLLAFTEDLNSWTGGLFPGATQSTSNTYNLPNYSDIGLGGAVADKCSDPLKNFQTCGTACPASCNYHNNECIHTQSSCTPGCFCRAPYILKYANDINSACVLPYHCPPSNPSESSNIINNEQSCKASNQIWTRCASKKCARSCDFPAAEALLCVPDDCRPGCICRAPFVMSSRDDPDHCILPEHCPVSWFNSPASLAAVQSYKSTIISPVSTITTKQPAMQRTSPNNYEMDAAKCSSQDNKEWRSCASSCPLGCDNLESQLCTPCVSGCFCKNGYIFENSTNWRNSECIVLSKCPKSEQIGYSSIDEISSAIEPNSETQFCPRNTTDRNGRTCFSSNECGFNQKCCAISTKDNNGTDIDRAFHPQKCTCVDPNAIWIECGTVCPNYCGADAALLKENCPNICNPGCFCISGYVKESRDSKAKCIPKHQCFNHSPEYQKPTTSTESTVQFDETTLFSRHYTHYRHDFEESSTTTTETSAKVEDSSCGDAISSAVLYARNGVLLGRLYVRPERRGHLSVIENRKIRITGKLELAGASTDPETLYYLAIHQFSDTTIGGCRNVGKPLLLTTEDHEDTNGFSVSSIATNLELKPSSGNTVPVDWTIIWSDPISPGTNPLIGHSIVLKTFSSKRDALLSERNEEVAKNGMIACAVLGIVPSC